MSPRTRANGEGSISPLPNGTFLVRVPIGRYVSGQVKYTSRIVKTRREANTALRQLLALQEQGVSAAPLKQPLGVYLAYWLEEVVKPSKQPATHAINEKLVRLHIVPYLGHIPVGKLTDVHVQQVLNAKLKSGLATSHVQRIRDTLRNALNHLVKTRKLLYNVAKMVELPTIEYRAVQAFTVADARQFIAAARNDSLAAAWFLAMLGPREGELLGLRWDDIDFDGGWVQLRQQVGMVDGKPMLKKLKTKTSQRRIPLPAPVLDQLVRHRAAQQPPRDLVFASPRSDGPWRPRSFLRRYHQLLATAKLDRRPFHHVRHSAVSLLRALGVDAKVVEAIVGHTNQRMTDHYTHVHDDGMAAGVRVLDTIFEAESEE